MNRTRRIVASAVILAVAAFCALPALAQQARQSPHETVSARINPGNVLVTVTYGRPLSKGRKIWGELVPWGKAWRAGADEATTLITPVALEIEQTTIPAGAYTLYMVPSKDGASKLAFSKKIGYWGIPVDEGQDLARVDMKKDPIDKQLDQFTISIEKGAKAGGAFKLAWENEAYSVPFNIKK